jgi:hypothetical protein
MIRFIVCLMAVFLPAVTGYSQEPIPVAPSPNPAPATAPSTGNPAPAPNGETTKPAETVVQEPMPCVTCAPTSFYPYYSYGPNYYMAAYTPGYVYPAYNYTPISPIAYPVYGYYPYPYYSSYGGSPFYSVGYSTGYSSYGGYYSSYPAFPGVGWYVGYGSPVYMGW